MFASVPGLSDGYQLRISRTREVVSMRRRLDLASEPFKENAHGMYDGRMSRRLQSIDVVRGLVMVVMAVDHARDYLATSHFDPMDPAARTPRCT